MPSVVVMAYPPIAFYGPIHTYLRLLNVNDDIKSNIVKSASITPIFIDCLLPVGNVNQRKCLPCPCTFK